jgi:hypothetical protein
MDGAKTAEMAEADKVRSWVKAQTMTGRYEEPGGMVQ